MAAAQQLVRAGHDVTLFGNDRGAACCATAFPDFKLEKA